MNLLPPQVDRRTLLIGGGAGAGLVVAFALWPRRPESALTEAENEHAFGHYVKVGVDGRVTVAVPQAETGQGVWTALPQILADELGAPWDQVAVEPAPHAAVYINRMAGQQGWFDGLGTLRRWRLPAEQARITAGSTSVRAFEQLLRDAGAAARAMLIAAAAGRWGVDADECDAADGFVLHQGKALGFGELAEDAGRRSPPRDPPRRSGGRGRLMGQPLPRIDLAAKSDGSFRFAGDVRLPGMLFASARLAPAGGRLTGFSRDGAMATPGVRAVVVRKAWIAVVADNWWAAERALRAAGARFEGPVGEGWRAAHQAALGEARTWFERGDYDAAVEDSRPLAASYEVAPASHFGLEPLSATARLSGGRLEIWAATQAPGLAHAAAERVAGGAAVTFYPMPVGDGGGRALEADVVPIAAETAREVGRPVQVRLAPDAAQNYGRLAAGAIARMTALPGPGGITAAWKMRVATSDGLASAVSRQLGLDVPIDLGRSALAGAVPPYAIPNLTVEAAAVRAPAAGYMRGHPERALTFFTESFVDELARAAGLEPFAFRMAMLGSNPRLARCLQAATSASGWDGGGRGSTMGLAAASAYGSNIALVADVAIGADQRIEVHRLTAAVDCGRIVNPQLVRQQVEGGLIYGLGLATAREPEWIGDTPKSRPLGLAALPRIKGTPRIDVHLVPSGAAPGGVSGLGVAILAPAIANALFAGTGKRLRSLPFNLMSVS